jgi:hypothetical protein
LTTHRAGGTLAMRLAVVIVCAAGLIIALSGCGAGDLAVAGLIYSPPKVGWTKLDRAKFLDAGYIDKVCGAELPAKIAAVLADSDPSKTGPRSSSRTYGSIAGTSSAGAPAPPPRQRPDRRDARRSSRSRPKSASESRSSPSSSASTRCARGASKRSSRA